ncbi:hypothetical protein evm_007316 [Chilo suppressalis]|nr:hypothetical protein evm_007316 [Chilo suppressalis]
MIGAGVLSGALVVPEYAFNDHTPPNMELIQPFCEDVHNWLSADSRNVAVVHCKAGKGRTGTMVCCYLLYSGQKATADEALQFYGTKRAHDEKGVTIPSQRRYVEYYAALLRSRLQYAPTKLYIRELVMSPPPMLNGGQCSLELTVTHAAPAFKVGGGGVECRRGANSARVVLGACTPLRGDVRVDLHHKPKMMRKEKLFHFWFNTFFVAAGVGAVRIPPPSDSPNQETFKLTLNKWQLDDAHKDKQHKIYSPDFKVEVIVQKQPDSSTFSVAAPRAGWSASSASLSDNDNDNDNDSDVEQDQNQDQDNEPDGHWDSGESTYL